MRLALLSANLGDFDPPAEWPIQQDNSSLEVVTCRITDNDYPPRYCSMTPRLQARIVKCFGWEFVNADAVIWLDASLRPRSKTTALELYQLCGNADICVFQHPERSGIIEEAAYLKKRIMERDRYMVTRYDNEDIEGQLKAIPDVYKRGLLLASGCFIYKNTEAVRSLFKEWWYHISRFHAVDQIAFTYLIMAANGLNVKVISDNLFETPYIEKIRPARWKVAPISDTQIRPT